MKSMPLDKASYEGNLKFKVRYGYPGNEVHVIERNLTVTFTVLTPLTSLTQGLLIGPQLLSLDPDRAEAAFKRRQKQAWRDQEARGGAARPARGQRARSMRR